MHAPAARPVVAVTGRESRARARWAVPLALMLAAFAIRGWQFGTPLLHVDEDFYLFVGDRMLHGALPYVDIWDRKPIGLFLLYAGIRLLGGGGIVEYQVVATLFAGATAAVLARIAARYAPPVATIVAGLLYLGLLGLNDGMGGQSPVFYNLPVAIAALLAMKAWTEADDPARIRHLALGAMALCGIAMQIKYSALYEGGFFGLAFMLASRRAGRSRAGVVADAALWIAVAILPTLLAIGYYAAQGQAETFLFANFLWLGQRGGEGGAVVVRRLAHTAAILGLPLACVVAAAWVRPLLPGRRAASSYRFVLAWLGIALAAYAIFGTYYDHYALPLVGPIAAAAAPAFAIGRRRAGAILSALLLMLVAWRYQRLVRINLEVRGGAAALDAEVAAIAPRLHDGCLWVYRGDSLLYYRTRSCLYSRYAFPGHLWQAVEAHAIGIDPVAEVRRILAQRPPVIVYEKLRHDSGVNPPADALVNAALAHDYRLVLSVGRPVNASRVFVRRDLR